MPSLVDRLAATSRRPANLGARVDGAISLAMGEPFGGTPQPIVDAAVMALRSGRTRYEPLTGSPRLRARLAEHLTQRSGVALDAGNVVVTHGATAGLAAAILTLVRPGDVVVLPEPTYSLYADHVAMAGGQVRWVACGTTGRLPIDTLARAVAGARMVVLCNPGNPTGRVVPPDDIQALADLTDRHEAYLLVDEAYSDIVFDGLTVTTALTHLLTHPRIVGCGTFSKTYAMTGWRLGWIVARADLADRINLVHRTINGSLATFVQDAALAALDLPAEYIERLRREFEIRRDLVVEALSSVPTVELATPQGAFYAFPRIHGCTDSHEITTRLAADGVLVRAGREFGPSGEGHLRVSFATDLATLEEGLDRLATGLRRLDRTGGRPGAHPTPRPQE